MNIPEDKVLHFLAGMIIAIVAYVVTSTPWVSVAATILVGIGKEIWDSKHDGHVADPWDAVVTILPGVIVYLLASNGAMHVHP